MTGRSGHADTQPSLPADSPVGLGGESSVWSTVAAGCGLLTLGVVVAAAVHAAPVAAVGAAVIIPAGSVVLLRYPCALFLVIIALIPADSLQHLPGLSTTLSLTKFLFPPLLIAVGIAVAGRRLSVPVYDSTKALILFAAAIALSSVFMEYPSYGRVFLRKYFSLFMLYFVAISLVNTRRRLKLLLAVIVVSCLFSAGAGALRQTLGLSLPNAGYGAGDRMTGVSSYNPNVFAAQMMVGLCLVVPFYGHPRLRARRLLATAAIALLFYAIISSFSRGTLVAFALTMMFFLWTMRKRLSPAALILVPAGAAFAVALLMPPEFRERIESMSHLNTDLSMFRRLGYHIVGLRLFAKSPLVGIGPGNFPAHYADPAFRFVGEAFGRGRFLHNMFLSIVVETGLAGITAFGLALAASFRALNRAVAARDRFVAGAAQGVRLAFFSFLSASLFLPNEKNKYLWVLFALSYIVERLHRESLSRNQSSSVH